VERTLPISNLRHLTGLETSRLEKIISPHKIERSSNESPAEILTHDLIAINEFLHYVDAEPFITLEKAENRKRVAFKKIIGG